MQDRLSICSPDFGLSDALPPIVYNSRFRELSVQEMLIRRLVDFVAIAAIVVLILFLLSHFWAVLALMGLVQSWSSPLVALLVALLYGISPLLVILAWTGWHNRKDEPVSRAGDPPG
jgi:cytochrome bd-type quinol oxidase subunit 2